MKPSISLTQSTLTLLSLFLIISIWSWWATSPAMAHKTDECGNINNQIILDIENDCIDDAWERSNVTEITQPNEIELDTIGNLIVAGSEQDDIIVLTLDEHNLTVGGLLDLPEKTKTGVRTLEHDKAQVALDQINDHIVLDTKGGNDTLIVEFDGATLTKPIFFEGGDQPSSGQGDVLEIRGSATVSSATLNFINPHDGSVQLAGQAPIHYRGLEPISFSLTPSVVVLDYDTTAETITISDSGIAGQTTIASTNGETLTITNPTASLQINAGDTGDDVINVNGFGSGFDAALTIDGQGGTDTINVNTALNLDGNLSLSGESINLNDGTMSTGAGTNGGTIDLTGSITLGTDIVIDANGSSSGRDITFSGEVDGGYGLTVNTSGTTLFDENIGSMTNLTTVTTDAGGTTVMQGSGSSTNNSAIITTGAQTYNDTVLIATNTSLKSSTSLFFGDTIDSQSGNRALILNFITWGTLTEAVGANQPLSALLVNTNGTTLIKGGEVTTTGKQEYYNNIEVDAVSNTTTLSAGSANVRLGQTSNNDVRSSTAGEDSLIIDTTGTTNLYAQVGKSGSQNLDQLTFNGPLTMHTGVVNTTGAQTYGSTITLEADSVLDSSSSGDITFSGEVDGEYSLTVNTSGTALFDENIGSTTSLTTVTTDAGGTTVMQGSGSSTNNSAIITTGAQTYNDPVLIATNTSLKSSTSIFFGDTIDSQSGNRALILNFITWGTLTEAVGANQPLSALLVNTNGTTLIKGGEVTTTGKQEYYNNIEVDAVSNTTILSAGSANVRLGQTSNNDVRSSTAGEDSLIIDTNGTANLYAQVGKSGSQNLDQLTFNGPVTIHSSLVRTTGDQTYSDAVTLNSDVTLTADDVSLLSSVDNGGFDLSVDVAGTASSITGVVSGAGGLVKQGDGTLALTAANTYTGTTTISAGVLQANNSSGSATSTEQVTVDDGGTLAGTGTVAGSTVVNTNGSVAPGTGPGVLTTGDLSLNDSAILVFEVNGTTAGTEYDQIKVNGSVNLAASGSGGVLSATIGFSPVPANQTFLLIDNDGSDAVIGTFADLPEGELFTIDDYNYSISYVGGDGNDVVLQAELASLTVIKEASLQDGTDFDFTWTSGTFTLDDALPDDGDGITDTEVIVNLDPGTYAITETVPFGWHLSSTACTGSSDSGNLSGTTLSVLIGLGEHVVCTFNNVPNTDPVATDDVYTTDEEVTLTVIAPGVLDNDSDTDGDPLTAALVDDVSNGTLSFSSDGSFVFTPTVDFAGSDTFTYSVDDDNGGVVTATVDITVNNVNDAPVLASIDNQTITETVELTFTATATDIDLPTQTLTYGLSNEPSGASIDSSGLFSWIPSNAQGPGVYTFTVVVSDTDNLTDSQQIEVTVTDLDIDYSVEVAPTSVTEGDSSTQPIAFTLTRSGAIGFASQVDYSFGGTATIGDDYSGSTTTVNFAADEISQTVVVTILDDSVVEADETISLSLLNGTAPSGGLVSYTDQTISSTIVDDDSAGITITSTPPLTISEPDATTAFTITLTSQPTDAVTINLSSSDPSECTVPASVDLTSLTWQTGVPVTVSAVDDLISDGAQLCTVLTSVTSSDPSYSGLDPDDVNLTVNDDDVPNVLVSTTTVDVTEGGATDQYAFQLTTIPTDTVTISFVTSSQLQPLTPITFAADVTALEPLTVTVQAVDDAVVEGDHSGDIAHTISGGGYDGVALADVLVAITDNDQSFAITADQVSVMEGDTGTTDISFIVTRTGAVTTTVGSVDFTLSGTATSDSDYINVAPASSTVSFAAGEIQQTIALQVLGDAVVELNETVIITLTNPTGPGEATLTTFSAQTIISDDDTAGFTVAPTSGLTTTETGDTASFSVRLNTQPTSNVTVTLTSSDSGEGTISPTELIFSPSDWQTDQTVTVTGQDDSLADGDVAYTIQTSADSGDNDYDTLDPDDVNLTNLDDDQPGVEVTPTNLTVQEPNGSDTFAIRLTSQPTDTVTINLSSSDTTECTVSLTSVELTHLTWQTGVTITVSAVDDGLTDEAQPCTIITSVINSSDPKYDNLVVPDVNVTVTEVPSIYLPLIVNGG